MKIKEMNAKMERRMEVRNKNEKEDGLFERRNERK